MTKKAVTMARVSTTIQAREGFSVETQLAGCRKYAELNAFEVVEELQDAISGAVPIADRPAGKRLYELIDKRMVDVVILYTNDRTARDEYSLEYLLLKDRCYSNDIELHYSDSGKDDNTVTGNIIGFIKAQIAAEERKKIIERSTRGKRAKAQNGHWVGTGTPRFGYKRIGVGHNAYLAIDESKAHIVQRVFSEYVGTKGKKPLSIKEITKRLNRENVRAPQGTVWYPETIREMLKSEAYVGRFHFGGVIIDLPEMKLISHKTFAQAQDRMERNKKLSQRNRKFDYLLSGYIKCVCGHIMRGHTLPRGDTIYKYYMCGESGASFRAERRCTETQIRAREAECLVWSELEKLFDNDTLKRGLDRMAQRSAAELQPKRDRLVQVEGLLKQCETRIERLMRDWGDEDNEDLRAAAKVEIKRTNKQREGLIKERDGLNNEIAQAEFSPEIRLDVMAKVAEVMDKIHNATYEKKRYLLDKLDVQLTLRHDAAGRWLDGTCGLGNFSIETGPSSAECRDRSLAVLPADGCPPRAVFRDRPSLPPQSSHCPCARGNKRANRPGLHPPTAQSR